jgi:hypothetical protein
VVLDLRDRAGELSRIIDEYALDAIEALAAPSDCFTDVERSWVAAHASWSLEQIEKATLRLVALRTSRNLSGPAARLDMAPVSLARWLARRPRVAPDSAAQRTACPCFAVLTTDRVGTVPPSDPSLRTARTERAARGHDVRPHPGW